MLEDQFYLIHLLLTLPCIQVPPYLHPLAGLMQVRHQAKGFAALDLDTVLISPLKRTL
jgi:hypothetical protein